MSHYTRKVFALTLSLLILNLGQMDVYASGSDEEEYLPRETSKKRASQKRQTSARQMDEDDDDEEDVNDIPYVAPKKQRKVKIAYPRLAEKTQDQEAADQGNNALVIAEAQGADTSVLYPIRQVFYYWLSFSSEDDRALNLLSQCSKREYHWARNALAKRQQEFSVLNFLYYNIGTLRNSRLPITRELLRGSSPLTVGSLLKEVTQGDILLNKIFSEIQARGHIDALTPFFLILDWVNLSHNHNKYQFKNPLKQFAVLAETDPLMEAIAKAHFFLSSDVSTQWKRKQEESPETTFKPERPAKLATLEQVIHRFTNNTATPWIGAFESISENFSSYQNEAVLAKASFAYYGMEDNIHDQLRQLLCCYIRTEREVQAGRLSGEKFQRDWEGFKKLYALIIGDNQIIRHVLKDYVVKHHLLEESIIKYYLAFVRIAEQYMDPQSLKPSRGRQFLLILAEKNSMKLDREDVRRNMDWLMRLSRKHGYGETWPKEVFAHLVVEKDAAPIHVLSLFKDRYVQPYTLAGPQDVARSPYAFFNAFKGKSSMRGFLKLLEMDRTNLRTLCENGFLYEYVKHNMANGTPRIDNIRNFFKTLEKEKLLQTFGQNREPLCFWARNLTYLKVLTEIESANCFKAVDAEGNTLLHKAVTNGTNSELRSMIEFLAQRGCNANARNRRGETAREIYVSKLHKEGYSLRSKEQNNNIGMLVAMECGLAYEDQGIADMDDYEDDWIILKPGEN